MLMFRRTHRAKLDLIERRVRGLSAELSATRHVVITQKVELELVKQARVKADADVVYWKTRAEKFIDQIGLRAGTISEPTMTPSDAPVESRTDTVFRALGVSELHPDKGSSTGAATTAPTVTGVNAADAMAAVHDVLAIGTR